MATDAAGNQATSALTRPVDNNAPAVSMPAIGAVRGMIDLPVTASDAGTGVASVTVQILLSGTWTDACTDTTAPWACTGLDSTSVPDGVYQARAIAVDGAGRSTTSSTINVRVDNTAPSSATLVDPGAYLRGSVALSGTAADAGSGVASWTVQYRLSGGRRGPTPAADTGSPYGCSWATTGVADGLYDAACGGPGRRGEQHDVDGDREPARGQHAAGGRRHPATRTAGPPAASTPATC